MELQCPQCGSSDLKKVSLVYQVFDADDFERHNDKLQNRGDTNPDRIADLEKALAAFNKLVQRQGLTAYFDDSSRCHLRSTGTGVSTATFSQLSRPFSQQEIKQRQKLEAFLEGASEDDFIEKVLVPLFQRLGFRRVSSTGHKYKSLEFGKDLWMKFQLPTSHWIYFCAQVKKGKIDSNNASGTKNVASLLNQARMAIDHPLFDPEANRRVLLDHLFLISAGEITKAARSWLLGWSQEKLAEVSGLHWTFVGRCERGTQNISLRNVGKLTRALRTTPSKLLKGVR